MVDEKEYWEQMIGFVVLMFTTYTIIKDFFAEPIPAYKTVMWSGFFVIVLFFLFSLFLSFLKKRRGYGIKS